MPIIVSFFIRQLIIIGVQLGLFALIDKYVTPLLNSALAGIISATGVDKTKAQDILANEIISTAESLGLTVALSKARLPLAIADGLGFTTKGFKPRVLGSDVDAKLARARAGGGFGSVAPLVITEAEATTVVAAAKSNKLGFAVFFGLFLGVLTNIQMAWMNIANTIDFGNWNSGAYQKTFQKIFAYVTGGLLVPDEDYRKTKTVSPAVFDKVYNAYKDSGVFAISDPFKRASVMFTRDNLIDLLDKVGAELLTATHTASTKQVLAASQTMMSFPLATDVAIAPITTKPAASVAVSSPTVKVFTGIVSQGVLGAGLTFTARPNDLIESADDLQQAASNNLAATLAALPASLSYEIKIVSSVVTKDGFRQTGSSQQIITGYNKNGTPKYRTVVNRFATLAISLTNDKGTRTKIRTIVLGPTNVLKFNPNAGQITGIETLVKNNIITSDTAQILSVAPSAPLAVATVAPVPTPAPVPVAVATSSTPTQQQAALGQVVTAFTPSNSEQAVALARVIAAFST